MAGFHNPTSTEEAGELGLRRWDLLHRRPPRGSRGRRASVVLVASLPSFFFMPRDFIVFGFSLFSLRTHTAYCKHGVALSHLTLYYSTVVRTGMCYRSVLIDTARGQLSVILCRTAHPKDKRQ